MLHVDTVGDTNGKLDILIAVVLGHVLEVLVEQLSVEERDDAAIEGDNLSALITDALHFSQNAVTLDIVTHSHAARHQRQAIDEVLENVLHRKAETGGQTCRNERYTTLGNLEQDKRENEVAAPHKDGDDVVGKCDIRPLGRVVLGVVLDFELLVKCVSEIVDIIEHKEQRDNERYFIKRHLQQVFLVDEVVVENLYQQLFEVKHVGCKDHAHQNGGYRQDG